MADAFIGPAELALELAEAFLLRVTPDQEIGRFCLNPVSGFGIQSLIRSWQHILFS
jgi:hypothetical protein